MTTSLSTNASDPRDDRLPTGPIAIGLALIAVVVFLPGLWNDFVSWDDHINFLTNQNYRGLGITQLRWMFTSVLMGHWVPLTWMTLGLDYTLWGMNPAGYHLTNILIHALNVSLVYIVSLRVFTLAKPAATARARHAGAIVAALFFGLHPLRAESVAWVTERRDVLSTAFFLLSVLLYLRAHTDAAPRRRRFVVFSLVAFALSIVSKSMVMTLPAVLVILDVYPLRRIRLGREHWPETRAVLYEKLPFVVLGIIAAALGVYGQSANKFFTSFERYPTKARIALVAAGSMFYVWKTILPVGLGPMYELPKQISLLDPYFAGAWVALLGTTLAAIMLRRRCPAILAGWAFYLVTVAPVSGIAHAGHQVASDRYSYLPSLGLTVLAGGAVMLLLSLRVAVNPLILRVALASVAALLLTLSGLTWFQVQVWKDTETLWSYSIDGEPSCSLCYANLGAWYHRTGNPQAALRNLEMAVRLRPDRNGVRILYGMALVDVHRYREGLEQFEKRLADKPDDVDTIICVAVTLMRERRYEAALEPLTHALQLKPENAMARLNYATALAQVGRRDEALAEHRHAMSTARDGESAHARFAYASTLAKFGDLDGARAELGEIGRLDTKLAAELALELSRPR